jgi:hypothetical protein
MSRFLFDVAMTDDTTLKKGCNSFFHSPCLYNRAPHDHLPILYIFIIFKCHKCQCPLFAGSRAVTPAFCLSVIRHPKRSTWLPFPLVIAFVSKASLCVQLVHPFCTAGSPCPLLSAFPHQPATSNQQLKIGDFR